MKEGLRPCRPQDLLFNGSRCDEMVSSGSRSVPAQSRILKEAIPSPETRHLCQYATLGRLVQNEAHGGSGLVDWSLKVRSAVLTSPRSDSGSAGECGTIWPVFAATSENIYDPVQVYGVVLWRLVAIAVWKSINRLLPHLCGASWIGVRRLVV
jgi:hypothetical protein